MNLAELILVPWLLAVGADEPRLRPDPPRFAIEVPPVVLTDVPVSRVRITALDEAGAIDATYTGRPLIEGVVLVEAGREAALPAFESGVCELATDLPSGRKVYVTGERIVVDPGSRRPGELSVRRTWRWLSVVPPLVAIGLAVWLRSVLPALFVGVLSGGWILDGGNLWTGFVRTLDTHLLGQLAGDAEHVMIILFTMFLGAMIGVMSRSGGTAALVKRLTPMSRSREHGQLLTWALGLLVFFDDYANTLLVGGTMRPSTDRLRISREKLAFLVDSTAAPVAGLAIVSTWVGVEIGYIQAAFQELGVQADAYSTFLATLPYRFYPLHLLVFVLLIAYSGRDYGPMFQAESRALQTGQVHRPQANVPVPAEAPAESAHAEPPQLLRNAVVPLAALLLLVLAGLFWTGRAGLEALNRELSEANQPELPVRLWTILKHSRSNEVLFVSSFFAAALALLTATATRALTFSRAVDAWLEGARSMFVAVVILVLAWGIAEVCNGEHLNTAGFLVELTRGLLSPRWMPTLAFLTSCTIAFATGSSWSTMGLLMPLFISINWYLLVDAGQAEASHPVLLATIGGVLAGAIFGDHCSPISDTTVLSSAASGCDHLDHVATQLPYAVSVAGVSVCFGTIPAGFGYSPYLLLPLGAFVLYLFVQFLGRPAETVAAGTVQADVVPARHPAPAEGGPVIPPDMEDD